MINLKDFFSNPPTAKQKQYEAVRAIVIENLSAELIAERFGYSIQTVYSLVRDAKAGKINLFPENIQKGPQERRTSKYVQDKIIKYRTEENLSSVEICERINKEGIKISVRTVDRILIDAGFTKLKRRTRKERGVTNKTKLIPERSENIVVENLDKFKIECPTIGVYFFLPYIIESGVLDIVKHCQLPESSSIGNIQACLSILELKLIGNKRLSHMDKYDNEPGLGIFAGLNILPKREYMGSYSCRTSEDMVLEFQSKLIMRFEEVYSNFYGSEIINLDFHSIPHYGEESKMEKVWCGARGKTMKGANTIFVQDGSSDVILYTRADILRKNEAQEIKKFVSYWKKVKGKVNETLVFDCKLTNYSVLAELMEDNIKFITLRKRNEKLLKQTYNLPKEAWKKVTLSIPKRKHKSFHVNESEITLPSHKKPLRQIILKDHGRPQPTYIITNNRELKLIEIIEVYAKRWHIENKLSEVVTFFNLNALSSPVMIRIHFDILWTLVADTLYHRFAQDLPRFEKEKAQTIFRKFIDMPGQIIYDGDRFIIKIRKRAYTPILMGVPFLQKPFKVPWLNNKYIEIVWTA